jgi:hypothetical protein
VARPFEEIVTADIRVTYIEIAADYARRFLPEHVADDLDPCAAIAATMRSPVASSQ